MKISDVIGIDVSKLTIDVVAHGNQNHGQFENSNKGFREMCKWALKNSLSPKKETMFVFEHTGLYSYKLAIYLDGQGLPFNIVPGLEIKRSLGISRGKDDRTDASKIARYGYRLRDEMEPYELPSEDLEKLKRLLSLRNRLVKQNAGYKASLSEWKRVLVQEHDKVLFDVQEKMIKYLSKQINAVEKEMDTIIKHNDKLKKQYDLITGIKSIGPQTALFMIVYTAGFTKFKSWRQFASYCGTAPFPYSSGTSIMGRDKVSHLANKKIKSLLDQCAKIALIYNTEMKLYYNRRIDEGKNEKSTRNIIRNKLLARIFAVVQSGKPYVETMKFASL